MEFKIKKMTVKDSREIKKRFEDCIKLAEEKGLQVGSVLNMEMQDRLKEINLKVKKETAEQYRKDGFSEEMIAAFLGHRVTRSLENYGYARSGKGGPKVAGVEHSNAIKSNTRRYKSKTTPGGGNPSPTRKRALK